MNTKNTKSAIISLLMIANIFFVYNTIMFNIRTQNIPADMIDNAVSILNGMSLNGDGFSLDDSAVPAKKPVNYIYAGKYSGTIFEDIVGSFSGIPNDEISGIPLPPENKIIKYTAGSYIFIFVDKDYLSVCIIEASNEKSKEDYTALERETGEEKNALIKTGVAGIERGKISKTKDIIKNFINKYPVQDIKCDFDIIGLKELKDENNTGTEYKAVINQKYDGLPISTHTAYIEIKDGAVSYFYGRWYFGTFDVKIKYPLLDSVNILFKCSEQDGKTVSGDKLADMSAEYDVSTPESEKFYLIPSWQLKFESGKNLSYSMTTGKRILNDK